MQECGITNEGQDLLPPFVLLLRHEHVGFVADVLGGAAHLVRCVHQLAGGGVRLAGAVREI